MYSSETIVVCDLRLATDNRSDKKFVLTSKLCPLGALCSLLRGNKHVLNNEKNCISDFRYFFETCNKWVKWNGLSVDIKILSPRGCLPSAPVLYTCIKACFFCIKSDFKDIFFKLATNERSDKIFLLTSKLCPLGLSAPALGLYTCTKSLQNLY